MMLPIKNVRKNGFVGRGSQQRFIMLFSVDQYISSYRETVLDLRTPSKPLLFFQAYANAGS